MDDTVSSQTGAQVNRLYPSLPTTHRLEACVLNRSSPKNMNTFAQGPDHLLENTQDEGSTATMKEQIRILEMQKQELLSINERWAKEYRVMVQYYKDKLHNLKTSLPHENHQHPSAENHPHVCKLNVLKDKIIATGSGDGLVKAQSEARQLQEQNQALARRWRHQNAEIMRLNKALKEVLVTTSSQEMSTETLQELWKHQADVYKEDFQTERKDREALKHKYLELEKKYKKVRNELYAIKSQVTCTSTSQPQYECACPHTGSEEKEQSTSNKLQRRYTFKDNL
ncbi:TNFAIP3-interacting protein 3-like [Periophthalmus magnuspinnatus]|uniref:TNFAIP3-interacting protein 3-like n=1 Tax=Periophthalmus magnuspinnatus TaxID=409849 RepID=UPI0024365D6B|nr:TNFAIP3-interacting protein 3-like [Periophthalmus magnuspinnatus]